MNATLPGPRSSAGRRASPSPPKTILSITSSMTSHVEQTQPRDPVLFEQTLVHELPVQSFELHGRHLRAIGSKRAVRLGTQLYQFSLRRRGENRCKQLLFDHRQAPFELFERVIELRRRGY